MRQPLLHEGDGDASHGEADEADDAGGPGKSNLRGDVQDHEREYDAAETTGCASNACGEGAAFIKVVADDGDGGIE